MRLLSVAVSVWVGIGSSFALPAAADPLTALEGTTAEQRANLQTEYMTQHLGLSGELLDKVKAQNLATAESVQPVIDGDAGMFTKMKALKAADADKDVALKALLPAGLYQKYEASKGDLRAYMEAGLKKLHGK